ncbi:hypothetical protein ERHA55_30370 [Erwinia rhapontici]|nr:hypothetical protein ERHA55_30370 [Erwinia rhapontici]
MSYQCPLCQQPLLFNQRIYSCSNHHQFDQAKEGYVNLLPVQHKRSKQPGDSADMMQARRNFLDAGHYQPLQQQVCDLLVRVLPQPPVSVLDIGCGEGYYTHEVANRLEAQGEAKVYGLDVAKIAVRAGQSVMATLSSAWLPAIVCRSVIISLMPCCASTHPARLRSWHA